MISSQNSKKWDENGIYFQYLKDVSQYPLLTRAEENVLVHKAAMGDERAVQKIVKSNLKFVINVANMYKGQGLSITELINEGNIGLIEAAYRFDPGRNIKFISYAVWWIRQAITRAISEKARLVRISAEKELVIRQFNKKAKNLRQAVGGHQMMDPEEIAEGTKYSPEQVESILNMGMRHTSLDAPLTDDGQTTGMELTANDGEDADSQAISNSEKALLDRLLEHLNPLELRVITLYFGVGQSYNLNLQEIGKVIGLSKERVRQVKEKALAQLRDAAILPELEFAA
jgi:RNA polymerase primary sigma factor